MGGIDTHEIGLLSLHCSRRAAAIGALKGFSKQWGGGDCGQRGCEAWRRAQRGWDRIKEAGPDSRLRTMNRETVF